MFVLIFEWLFYLYFMTFILCKQLNTFQFIFSFELKILGAYIIIEKYFYFFSAKNNTFLLLRVLKASKIKSFDSAV